MLDTPIDANGEAADAIVIGAGYSGLAAAWSLVGDGHSVIVLEARDRVGGRAWTQKFTGGFVDNGGQWIGPGMTQILALAQVTGVRTFPTFGEGKTIVAYKGERSEVSAIGSQGFTLPVPDGDVQEFMSAVATLDRLAKEVPADAPWEAPRAAEWDQMTMANWMDANLKTDGAKFAFQIVVGGYFSVEPSELSLLHLLFYIAAAGGVEGLEESSLTWRFDGGAQEIPNRLADRLGDRVKLETPVRTIDQTGDLVMVETDHGWISARRVIVALPPALASRIRYLPSLPPSRDQYTQRAPMGSTIKCHAVYPTPFWRERGLNGQILSDHDLNVTYDNSPPSATPGILVGFLEGAAARRWADRSAEDIQRMTLAAFESHFGAQARTPAHFFQANWANEPWSRGCYCGIPMPGTWTNYRDALRKPVGRLHWAGTETATKWAQYMEGAVRSGERAAAEVNEALTATRQLSLASSR
jgi:monoamine oxidase